MGRNGQGNELVQELYKDVFSIEINIDKTNNQKPTLSLEKLTGLKKNKDLLNYQASHVFGRTKNVFCFTAPWNIVFIPKVIDPFTGHEAKGIYVKEFQKLFKTKIYKQYKDLIIDYNSKMPPIQRKIKQWLAKHDKDKKISSIIEDFKPITPGLF